VLPARLEPLRDLALNLRWSWHLPCQQLFASIDPVLWDEVGHDPVRLIATVPGARWAALDADEGFRARVQAQLADLNAYRSEPRWYQGLGPDFPALFGYFSP
jgi:starch phosphorylase